MKKLLFAVSLLFASYLIGTAFAAPISTDLPSDTYVIKDGLKWTWASPVNERLWGFDLNRLNVPSFHSGWRFATDEEMTHLPTLADFGNGTIQSVAYWNSIYKEPNIDDFIIGAVASHWGHGAYETFYVSFVPEPATYATLLAGLSLIGFLARRRKLND